MKERHPRMSEQRITVDPEDPGQPDVAYGASFESQDEAFQSAMRRAIADGNEQVKEGVNQTAWIGH